MANDGDYAMLVSRYTIQHDRIDNNTEIQQRNHNTNNFIEWPERVSGSAELGPESRRRMRDWWHNPTQVSPPLRLQARDAYIPANTDYTAFNPEVHATETEWLSTPVQGSEVPDNPVFFLSEPEVQQRLNQPTPALRSGTNTITVDGNARDISGYWLRSVGHNTSDTALVASNGGWWTGLATSSGPLTAFRPTIWVHR